MKRRVIIENFAKIRHAELEIKPMMMFVGDNNSGKSYLMSLLWGLTSDSNWVLARLTDEVKRTKLYGECERYVLECIRSEGKNILSREWSRSFYVLLNQCIEQNKNQFVSDVFNKNIQIGKLELGIEDERKIEIEFSFQTEYNIVDTQDKKTADGQEDYIHYNKIMWVEICQDYHTGIQIADDYVSNCGEYVEFILRTLLRYWGELLKVGNNIVFLPSSRTGFVLSKNLLTNNIYENSLNRFPNMDQDSRDIYFTKPVISFLKLLNDVGEKEGKNYKLEQLAEFMEHTILHGTIEIQNKMSKSFLYKPKTLNEPIQMYLASAIVTEIAPLYLICKYRYRMTQVFIEEPEMCMHPKLQTIVARILIRLCNMGIPVSLTTHSDIIIQHVNNMLRVNNSDKKHELMEKYKIEEQDLLDAEKVGVYQFICRENDSSEIMELKAGDMGFETTTFSNAFEEMLELTYDI